jgi:putative CocE/NonD family hydrolase
MKNYNNLNITSLIILLSLNFNINAQKQYFDKNLKIESKEFDDQILKISEKHFNEFKTSDKLDSIENEIYSNYFKNDYNAILKNIDLYRSTLSKKEWVVNYFFLVEIFAKFKLLKYKKNINEEKSIEIVIDETFKNLKDANLVKLHNSKFKTQKLKEDLNNYVSKIKNDSISNIEFTYLLNYYIKFKTGLQIGNYVDKTYQSILENKFSIITKDVKLRNNVELTATIVRKKSNNNKLPVILINNIYAGNYDTIVAKKAAIHDYIGVVFNTRGKRNNQDTNNPFEHESEDIYEIIDWISKQEWCNGKVGMIGGSYLGFSQWAALKKLHPALKTIVPQVSVGIGTIDFPMNNKIFMTYSLRWLNYVTNNNLTDEVDFGDYIKWNNVKESWFKNGNKFRDLDSISGKKNSVFQKWLDHPSYDEFWQKMVPFQKEFSNIDIPILTTTGYYDADQRGALYYLKEHYKYFKNPEHYLIIGPYDHSTAQSETDNILYGYTLDEVARINITELSYEWFDYILKNKKKPQILKNKINFQIMDTNEWKHVENMEKTSNSKLKFYLTNINKNESVFNKPKELKSIKQSLDFKNRKIDYHYYKTENDSMYISKNTLVFESEPLEEDLIVSGSFEGNINVIINKKDFDFKVLMMEVRQKKGFFNLADFLGRASYLNENLNRNLITPFEKVSLPINNYQSMFVSKKLKKGSKIILFVNVNFDKNYEINYGTGKNVSEESILDANEPLEIEWFNDSYIEIPILIDTK